MFEQDRDILSVLHQLHGESGGDESTETLHSFLWAYGNCLDALMYGALFVPEFVVYQDMVLWADAVRKYPTSSIDELLNKDIKKTEIEKQWNFVDVGGLLFQALPEIRPARPEVDWYGLDLKLAQLIQRAWQAQLTFQFPDRRFKVSVEYIDDENEDYCVICCEDRA
ncbi:MAG: hypothetical protein H6814_11640 [Phycisphaeraceae bacterium]|nr:hypothetical protein [Phycisphaeraceae bacterium]